MTDEQALALAWQLFEPNVRPGNDDDREFAVYSLQCDNLKLKPWQLPPRALWGWDKAEIKDWDLQSYKILKQMERAKISIFHPDPLAALAALRKLPKRSA